MSRPEIGVSRDAQSPREAALNQILDSVLANCRLYQVPMLRRIAPEEAIAGERFEQFIREHRAEIIRRVLAP